MLHARNLDDDAWRATWSSIQATLQAYVPAALRPQAESLLAGCFDERPAAEDPSAIASTEAAEFFGSFASAAGPRDVVERLRERGFEEERLFLECFMTAQRESGRLWQYGRMSVAEEHRRTAIVRTLIDEAGARAPRAAVRAGTLFAACAPTEMHDIGLKAFASLAMLDGWRVSFLGGNLTQDQLFDAVVSEAHDVVAFAASVVPSVCALVPLIARLRRDPRTAHVPILVGGAPFNEFPELAHIVGADATASDAVAGCVCSPACSRAGGAAPSNARPRHRNARPQKRCACP